MANMQQSASGANHQGKEHAAPQHDMTELAQAHQGSTREESISAPSDMAGTEIWTTTENGIASESPSLPVGPDPRPDNFSDPIEGQDSAPAHHAASNNPQVDKSVQEEDQRASSSERTHPRH